MCIYQFTVDDLRERYGCETDTELSLLLDVTKGLISVWRKNGIPKGYQQILNIESKTPQSKKRMPLSA